VSASPAHRLVRATWERRKRKGGSEEEGWKEEGERKGKKRRRRKGKRVEEKRWLGEKKRLGALRVSLPSRRAEARAGLTSWAVPGDMGICP
jgi:hypothetical protein